MRTREPPAFSAVCDTLRPDDGLGRERLGFEQGGRPGQQEPERDGEGAAHSYLKASMGLSPAAFRAG